MATNLPSCFSIQFLEQLLNFLVNFTLLKYVKSQRSYVFLITNELIFGFQILDLEYHFSASLTLDIPPRFIIRPFKLTELSCRSKNKAWFPFVISLPFVARFDFLFPGLVFQLRCLFWSFVAFCCFSLSVLALSSFSWLLMSATFHWSRIGANERIWKSLLLLVACFGIWACFHLPCVAFCCPSLLVLVFEMELVPSQQPKQATAWLVLVFCRCFHLNIALLSLVFCWYEN